MATAPIGWPLSQGTGSSDTTASPCPTVLVCGCLTSTMGSLSPAHSYVSSTFLSVASVSCQDCDQSNKKVNRTKKNWWFCMRLNVWLRLSDVHRARGQSGAHHGACNWFNSVNTGVLVASLPFFFWTNSTHHCS